MKCINFKQKCTRSIDTSGLSMYIYILLLTLEKWRKKKKKKKNLDDFLSLLALFSVLIKTGWSIWDYLLVLRNDCTLYITFCAASSMQTTILFLSRPEGTSRGSTPCWTNWTATTVGRTLEVDSMVISG